MDKKKSFLCRSAIFALGLLILAPGSVAIAQGPEAQLPIPAERSTDRVIGITFSTRGEVSSRTGEVVVDQHGNTLASYPLTSSELQSGTFTSAMLLSSEGSTYFTPTYQTKSPVSGPASLTLPLCQPSSQLVSQSQSRRAAFESLIEVRVKRRENARQRTRQLLDIDTLDRLNRLEQTFGFRYSEPISADLPALELNHRVDQILHSLRQFRYYRDQQ